MCAEEDTLNTKYKHLKTKGTIWLWLQGVRCFKRKLKLKRNKQDKEDDGDREGVNMLKDKMKQAREQKRNNRKNRVM